MGFSDITSLLLAVHAKTGLVTFHGPVGAWPWPAFTVNYLKRVLFSGEKVRFQNPVKPLNLETDIILEATSPCLLQCWDLSTFHP